MGESTKEAKSKKKNNMRVNGETKMDRNVKGRKNERNKKGAPAFFDYLVVIDFEATCVGKDNSEYCQEIIQFPAVLIDTRSRAIKDEFCMFVKPVVNPTLTAYCTNLTGITQDLVENAVDFVDALRSFEEWLLSHDVGTTYSFTIVTDGSYDMGKFLYKQCQVSNIKYPSYARRWVNIRKAFYRHYRVHWYNLKHVLEILGETFEGRPHDGRYDARNIGKVVIRFLKNGGEAIENERILLDSDAQKLNGQMIKNDKTVMYGLDTVQSISRNAFFRYYNKGMNDDEVDKVLLQMMFLKDRDDSESSDDDSGIYRGKENLICPSPPGMYAFYPEALYMPYMASPGLCAPMGRSPYTLHCRITPLVPPPQFMSPPPFPHPKFNLYGVMRRPSNPSPVSLSASPEVPPQPRAQRPPGKFRRAVEALEK